MPEQPVNAGTRHLESGLPATELEPDKVCLRTEVLLAQAETLGRLLRVKDRERKLLWTFAVAYDSFRLHPKSMPAALNAARIARIAGQFDLAAKILRVARTLKFDESEKAFLVIEEHRLERQRDIDAAGSREQMVQQLIVYACQGCGRLIEYISIRCMFCGWQPLTREEMSRSGRLSTQWFSLWDLLGIGREIVSGRKAIEVVSNLTESAAASMLNLQYRSYVEGALDEAQKKRHDTYFHYLYANHCHSCGERFPGPDPFISHREQCHAKLRIPPPMRLLECLTRASIHFQHNFSGEKSEAFDVFIRYIVSLQSKLFRQQETPGSDERRRVVELMASLGKFGVGSNLGVIDMADPKEIVVYRSNHIPEASKDRATEILEDFRATLQLLADWMFRTKALY
jgi:hypothetical protein